MGAVELYDAVEVHGVRDCYTSGQVTVCEVDDDNPEFFSVYAHLREGGVECLEDFPTAAAAIEYGSALAARESWPLYVFFNTMTA